MNWEDHNKWAEKFGISVQASQYVNQVIDQDSKKNLPQDYLKAVDRWAEQKARRDGAKAGNSMLSEVIKNHTKQTHDKGAGSKTASDMTHKATIQFLRQKGDEYVTAYYLHHHLDYLSENSNSGKSLQQLVDNHEQSSSKPFRSDIADFLCAHKEELMGDLDR